MTKNNSLSHITVVDFSQNLPGPYCSRLLADLGARVIKIEPIKKGDSARMLPDFFQLLNFGKESLAINIKSQEGIEIINKLLAKADILIESFRPGVMEKLGLGYNQVKTLNPNLIYCSISGLGQKGPLADIPAHDLNLQAMSGLTELCSGGENTIYPLPIADFTASLFALNQILAGLYRGSKEIEASRGTHLDVSMAEGLMHMVDTWNKTNPDPYHAVKLFKSFIHQKARTTFPFKLLEKTLPEGLLTKIFQWYFKNGLLFLLPHYGIFNTKDNKKICIGIVDEQHYWSLLCKNLGGLLTKFEKTPLPMRVLLSPLLKNLIAYSLSKKNLNTWINELQVKTKLPVTKVYSPKTVFKDEHFRDRGDFQNFKTNLKVKSPLAPQGNQNLSSPYLGEHSEKIIKELGFNHEYFEQQKALGNITTLSG